jgi:hypothetical protein
MRRLLLPFTAIVSLSAAACGPTLPALIAAHRYDEAICLADDGTYHQHHDPALMSALVAELRPTLGVRVVTADEHDALFVKASPELRDRAREASKQLYVVKTRIERQSSSASKTSVSAYLRDGHQNLPELTGQDKLAGFFHETIPTSHQVGPGALDSVVAWGKDVADHPIANALTLGIWSALNGPSATSRTVAPTDEDFERLAPITTRMDRAYPGWPCSDTAQGPCTSSRIYLRPKDEGTTPIFLELTVSADAQQEGGVFTQWRMCQVYDSITVELPTGGNIEERFAAFGDQPRSHAELARMQRRPAPAKPAR